MGHTAKRKLPDANLGMCSASFCFIIFKVGRNMLVNRLSGLNNMIDLKWLNLKLDSFKIKCKDLLLSERQ